MMKIDTSSLYLEWVQVPWDTNLIGKPVLQITSIETRGEGAFEDIQLFESQVEEVGAVLVSCRMQNNKLKESMLLESIGFRFIEMTFQPELKAIQDCPLDPGMGQLSVRMATGEDLAGIVESIPGTFQNERFHVDPMIDTEIGDIRYANWVKNSLAHETQQLYVVEAGNSLVAFFVTERLESDEVYWHLNAVTQGFQGRGYGKRAWLSMINHAKEMGASKIRTSIIAGNYRVLNLYARLGFRFTEPFMTFHWTREKIYA